MAGTTLMMAAKIHEVRKMMVVDVVRWSGHRVAAKAVVNTEYRILEGCDYKLPLGNTLEDQQIWQECYDIEKDIIYPE